mgnify:CR=1 FL=1
MERLRVVAPRELDHQVEVGRSIRELAQAVALDDLDLPDPAFIKMDIEGAEVELLEKMIAEGSIDLMDVLYVEFHSEYQKPEESAVTQMREQRIISRIRQSGKVKLRIWH